MFTLVQHLFFMIFSFLFLVFNIGGLLVVFISFVFACIELYLWVCRQRRYNALNWCHPVPVFVLSYCIVFYQLPFCYLAGFELYDYSEYVIFAPENIPYCVLLAAIGLAAFFSGEQFCFLRSGKNRTQWRDTLSKRIYVPAYLVRLKIVTRILLVLTAIFFIFFLNSFENMSAFFGFSYGDVYAKYSPYITYYQIAYSVLLYLAILLQIVRLVVTRPYSLLSYVRSWDIWVLVVLAIVLVPFVLSGDRDTYLILLALVTVPYFVLVRPLKFKQALVIVVCMAFLLSLVGDIRGRTNISWQEALQSRIERIINPAQWPTMELANSFGTFNIATVYFPDIYPYNKGLGMIYRMVGIVPFLSSVSGIEQLNIENQFVYSSSLFFTNILTRGSFSSGSGTSSLADIYMDFSPGGIPIVMFFWGFFIAWISLKTSWTFSPAFVFLYAYYVYFSIYVNRSSFFFGWNILIWVIILFYFINKLYLKKCLIRK